MYVDISVDSNNGLRYITHFFKYSEFADFGDGGVEIVIPGRPVDGNEIFTFDASQLRPKLRTINTNLNRQYIVPSLRSFSNSPKVFDNSRIDQKRKVIHHSQHILTYIL